MTHDRTRGTNVRVGGPPGRNDDAGDETMTLATGSGANVRVGGGPRNRGTSRRSAGAAPVAARVASHPPGAAHAGRVALAALALLAACVRTTTVTYLPSPERPRLSLAEGGTVLARYLSIECESLLGRTVASSETRVRVAVDSVGNVTSSMLERSTGDAQADGLVGAVTAQLKLAALPPGATEAVVRASYRCAPEGGATATLLHP